MPLTDVAGLDDVAPARQQVWLQRDGEPRVVPRAPCQVDAAQIAQRDAALEALGRHRGMQRRRQHPRGRCPVFLLLRAGGFRPRALRGRIARRVNVDVVHAAPHTCVGTSGRTASQGEPARRKRPSSGRHGPEHHNEERLNGPCAARQQFRPGVAAGGHSGHRDASRALAQHRPRGKLRPRAVTVTYRAHKKCGGLLNALATCTRLQREQGARLQSVM